MATIRKLKSGNFQAMIRLSGLKDIIKTFSTKTKARQFVREVEGDAKVQQLLGNPVTNQLTIRYIIDGFMDQYSGKDISITGRLSWWLKNYGEMKLSAFNVGTARNTLNQLLSTGRQNPTVNRYKSSLSSVFEFAKENYGISNNPMREIKAKPDNPHRTRFLSDREQKQLLENCKQSDWNKLYLLVLMALTTGARRGKLTGLTWSDIDFNQSVARLTDTKNGSDRLLPLTSPAVSELKKFRGIGNTLVFHSTVSSNRPHNFRKAYNRALVQSGISDFRFHDLRHTAASNLAKNGATLLEIAEVLGHSNTTITKRYAHLCINHKRKLIDRVMGSLGTTTFVNS